jgi:hypothetical protein
MFLNFYLATTIPSVIIAGIFNRILIKKAEGDGFKFKKSDKYSLLELIVAILGIMLELVPVINMIIAYQAVKAVINRKEYINRLTALSKINQLYISEEERDSDINKTNNRAKDIETSEVNRSIQTLTQEERIQLGQALIEKQRLAREELAARAKFKNPDFPSLEENVIPDITAEDVDLGDEQHFNR